VPYVPGCEAAGRTEDDVPVYLFGDGRGVGKAGSLAGRVPESLPLRLPDWVDPALAAAAPSCTPRHAIGQRPTLGHQHAHSPSRARRRRTYSMDESERSPGGLEGRPVGGDAPL
jgi:hypothetical protein